MLELFGKKVLVTGGAGFIGSHLCESLLRLGCKVIVLDNFDQFYQGKERNLVERVDDGRFSIVRGSILDTDLLERSMRGVEVVFHLAGQAGVRYCIDHPLKAEEVNTVGTLNVLQAVRKTKSVKKVVAASSSSIYGKPLKPTLSEDHPLNPTNPYGVSKLAAEKYCLAYHETYGTPVTCLRYFSVYGPRGRPDQVIYAFAQQVSQGRPPVIYGDGKQSRDFTFVSDVVSGTLFAAMVEESSGQAFNIGYGREFSIAAIARMVIDYFGADMEPSLVPGYKGDFPRTLCNNTKARNVLRWNPQVSLESGLRQFLDWFTSSQVKVKTDAGLSSPHSPVTG